MRTKIKNWLISIDDRILYGIGVILKYAFYIGMFFIMIFSGQYSGVVLLFILAELEKLNCKKINIFVDLKNKE